MPVASMSITDCKSLQAEATLNLDQYMRAHGISNRQAERELGADRVSVSRWRSGLVRPGREWWGALVAWSDGEITEDVPKRRASKGE